MGKMFAVIFIWGELIFADQWEKSQKLEPLKISCHMVAGFVPSSPKFNPLVVIVNNQLVCLRPVGILNPVNMFKCLFLSLFVTDLWDTIKLLGHQ